MRKIIILIIKCPKCGWEQQEGQQNGRTKCLGCNNNINIKNNKIGRAIIN